MIFMTKLHDRNIHKDSYDLKALSESLPGLAECIISNPSGEDTIDFSDPRSVLLLNKALIKYYYKVENWMIPEGYLCPAVPGRADHIHYAADLLGEFTDGEIPRGKQVHVLDIGTGAGCIYPIIGCGSYNWKFSAAEIDPLSLKMARLIVQSNPAISKQVKIIQQKQKQFIFRNVIGEKDRFDLTVCNPPFHGSKKEAMEANRRKWQNLTGKSDKSNLNFGGMENELWYPGGETAFVGKMIRESADYGEQVLWFSSLVARKENLAPLEEDLKSVSAADYRVIPMNQGQKKSRLLAWTFLADNERKKWASNKKLSK